MKKLKKRFLILKKGEVVLIENIRYFKEETDDDESFLKEVSIAR